MQPKIDIVDGALIVRSTLGRDIEEIPVAVDGYPRFALRSVGVERHGQSDAMLGVFCGAIPEALLDGAERSFSIPGPSGSLDELRFAGRPTYQGFVDSLSSVSATGWARDCRDPMRRVEVVAVVDSEIIGAAAACEFREDLARSGIGDGKHAFTIAFDRPVNDAEIRRVSIFVANAAYRLADGHALVQRSSRLDVMSFAARPPAHQSPSSVNGKTASSIAAASPLNFHRPVWAARLAGADSQLTAAIDDASKLSLPEGGRLELTGHFGRHAFLPNSVVVLGVDCPDIAAAELYVEVQAAGTGTSGSTLATRSVAGRAGRRSARIPLLISDFDPDAVTRFSISMTCQPR